MNSITPQQCVDALNSMLAMDANAIRCLIQDRIPCNKALADHPTCQVLVEQDGSFRVGLLGVINGIFGAREDGGGYIMADFSDSGSIEKFEVRVPPKVTNAG